MPISDYLKRLRQHVGHDLLLMPGVAAIVRNEAGEILLQRRSDDGCWSLPGGSIDLGEAPAQAVVREVWEETGLLVVPTRLLGLYGGTPYRHTYPNRDRVEHVVSLFACRAVGGSLGGLDDESLELRYFAPADMPEMATAYPQHLFWPEGHTEATFDWDEAWLTDLGKPPNLR